MRCEDLRLECQGDWHSAAFVRRRCDLKVALFLFSSFFFALSRFRFLFSLAFSTVSALRSALRARAPARWTCPPPRAAALKQP